MNKFQRKREDTYRQLLEAGMHALFEQGYAGTRPADIAAATGHTTGAFYFHFRSKEDFFLHVLRYRERLRAGWQDAPLELDPAAVDLEEVVVRTLRDLSGRMGGAVSWTPVMADFHFRTKGDPEVRETLRAIYARWVDEIEAFVNVLERQGWIERGRDTRELAVQLLSLVEGAAAHRTIFEAFDEPGLVRGILKLLR